MNYQVFVDLFVLMMLGLVGYIFIKLYYDAKELWQ